jgi:hypothetical protein
VFLLATVSVLAAVVLELLGNIVSDRVPQWIPVWAWLMVLGPAVVLAVILEVRRRSAADPGVDLATAAADLRTAARAQWHDESVRLRLKAVNRRLPISWRPAAAADFSTPDEVLAVAREIPARDEAAAEGGIRLELARLWLSQVPSRRLVLLGETGSGKTELLYQLMDALLDEPSSDRIPVLIPAASWDAATTGFADWVAGWLAGTYSFLDRAAPGRDRRTLAEALLAERRLAIVVDGLDELPPDRARRAISRLGTEPRPGQYLLLSSRPAEYRAAVADGPFDGAVGVLLNAQEPGPVLRYLRDGSHGRPERWAPVAEAIERAEPIESAEPIGEVLRTPLMVMLADAVYNDRGRPTTRPGPAALVREHRTAQSLEDELLDGFLAFRYAGERRWRFGDVHHWLGYLAWASGQRAQADSINLAWWDLPMPWAPKRARTAVVKYLLTPAIALIWTAISTAVVYGLLLDDPNRGLTNAIRISAAVGVSYAALLFLSTGYRAALVAVLGAYLAGIISGSYDLAIVAGLAAGLCWPSIRVVRTGAAHALGVGVVAAAVPVLIRLADARFGLGLEISLVRGFAGGFADGWTKRWDADANGFVALPAIVTVLVWVALRQAPPADRVRDRPLRIPGSPPVIAAVAGVAVAVLGLVADGRQDAVAHGWMLAPADGFAAGFLIWYAASWSPGLPASARARRLSGLVAGVTAGLAGALAIAGRTDIAHPWAGGLADAIVIGLLAGLPRRPVTTRAHGRRDDRSISLFEAARVAGPAALAGSVTGGLDVLSAGAPGIAYGIAVFAILLHYRYRMSPLWGRRAQDAERSGAVRIEEAGLASTVVVGIVAGFGYALLYGVTVALTIKIALEIHGRSRPSTGLQPSAAGMIGAPVLGGLVAFGAIYSRVAFGWAVLIGLATAAAAVFAFGTVGRPALATQVLSPSRLLALDRKAFAGTTLGLAVTLGLAASTWTMAVHGWHAAVLAAAGTTATYGLTAGLVAATAQTRFGHYTAARLWLAADRKLPWAPAAFLEDAYRDRAVLRRNGAVYQFRHQRLQERLAQTYDPAG